MHTKPTLLIVDNEREILFSLLVSLRKYYRVLTAVNTTEARELLLQERIHIILCDMQLPGEKGIEFLIDARTKAPDIVRIMFSDHCEEQKIMEAVNRVNAFRFIYKPWTKGKIQNVLKEALNYYYETTQERHTDPTTKLNSAQVIINQISTELKRSLRYGSFLTCILISLENISTFQNHFGIDGVRQFQKKVADLIVDRTRDSDIAGFLEDESFLVLLTQTDEEGSKIFIDHLLPTLDKITLKGLNDDPVPQIKIARVTISDDRDLSVEELLSELKAKFN